MRYKKPALYLLNAAVAAVFLYFAFHGIAFRQLSAEMTKVPSAGLLLFIAAILVCTIFRAWRWWLLLPRPHRPGDWGATLRALFVANGLNMVLPRAGEAARVAILHQQTRRGIPQLTGTVVVERLLLDLIPTCLLLLYALYRFRGPFTQLSPNTDALITSLLLIIAAGTTTLLWVGLKPHWFLNLAHRLGAGRLPILGPHFTDLVHQLSKGIQTAFHGRIALHVMALTLIVWSMQWLMFTLGLNLFQIQPDWEISLALFAMVVAANLFPTPGAIGAYHFIGMKSLHLLTGMDETSALAVATFMHAIGVLTNCLAALAAYNLPTKKTAMTQDSQA